MILDEIRVLDLLRSNRSNQNISDMKMIESRMRVFTENLTKDEVQNEPYWNVLLEIMKKRSSSKFERVIDFARFPLPITSVSDSILTDLFKVFDGKNRNFNIDADRDIAQLTEWENKNKVDIWIENNARKVLKNKPCSFVVVDIDNSGNPYLLNIGIDRIIDAGFKSEDGDLEYIIFLHSEFKENDITYRRISVYDDELYRVYKVKKGDSNFELEVSNSHNIGYTPARAFMFESANDENLYNRRTAFSTTLAQMEDWTLFDIYRNFVDHYAPFPVTEAIIPRCDNPSCNNGVVTREEPLNDPKDPSATRKVIEKCITCESHKGDFIFPGTQIKIKLPANKDLQDASGKFRMIFPDTDKLKYVPNKLDSLEIDIRHKVVGINHLERTQEAVNELQMTGSFASMETVLMRYKLEFDKLYVWIVETVGRIFYKDITLKVDANFGTEFYLIAEEDLQARFDKAKKSGMPLEELVEIYTQLIETKYKGNPNKILRQKMMLKLDPLPLTTISESIDLASKGLIDTETLSMKVNFITFVNRFEEENAPITQFGSLLEMKDRLRKIREVLSRYNSEKKININLNVKDEKDKSL